VSWLFEGWNMMMALGVGIIIIGQEIGRGWLVKSPYQWTSTKCSARKDLLRE
jgi:hypothetical protein